jgi:hypothetical protein
MAGAGVGSGPGSGSRRRRGERSEYLGHGYEELGGGEHVEVGRPRGTGGSGDRPHHMWIVERRVVEVLSAVRRSNGGSRRPRHGQSGTATNSSRFCICVSFLAWASPRAERQALKREGKVPEPGTQPFASHMGGTFRH